MTLRNISTNFDMGVEDPAESDADFESVEKDFFKSGKKVPMKSY
jgi:hypothetical protein